MVVHIREMRRGWGTLKDGGRQFGTTSRFVGRDFKECPKRQHPSAIQDDSLNSCTSTCSRQCNSHPSDSIPSADFATIVTTFNYSRSTPRTSGSSDTTYTVPRLDSTLLPVRKSIAGDRVWSIAQFVTHFSHQSEPSSHQFRQETLDQGKMSSRSRQGVLCSVEVLRVLAGAGPSALGYSASSNWPFLVRILHSKFATAAIATTDISATSSEEIVFQPSVATLELVAMSDPTLLSLEEELTEDQGCLSHVTHLDEKLRCLRDWGLTDEDLVKLRNHLPSSVRSALLKNSARKMSEVAVFLAAEVGLPKEKVAEALLGNVFLASSSIEDCLRPKVQYLQSLGIPKEQVVRVINRCPQILTYSLEQRVLPLERKLLDLGIKREDVGKAVMKYPGLFGTGISKIDRNIKFLRAAGVVEMAKCICRHPQILSLSLDGKIHDLMAFLKSDLHLSALQINKIISLQPSIFTYSVDSNLKPKVIYFEKLGIEKQEIGRMYATHPALVGHSVETGLKPKIDYLINVMNRELNEIIVFPQFLSYSLRLRIQPRYEFLAERGIHTSLSSMLSCSPEVFHKRYSSKLATPIRVLLASRKKIALKPAL